jgi:uncharacterized tellurite resistance protein B-like protein
MYADGHLASIEDSRIQRLLRQMGVETEYDIDQVYDASVSRVSRHSQTHDDATAFASTLAAQFTSPEERNAVMAILNDLLFSDGRVVAKESSYLAIIKTVLES